MATFRFGDFEADEERFELRHRGERRPVQRIALDVLLHLIHHRHRVVTRQELQGGPWGGAQVTAGALARAVMLARRATSPTTEPVIETVRGRGYRFVATVLPEAGAPNAGPPNAGPPEAGPPEAGPPEAGPAQAPAPTPTGTAPAGSPPATSRWLQLLRDAEGVRLPPEVIRALLEEGLTGSPVLLILPLPESQAALHQGTSGSGTE